MGDGLRAVWRDAFLFQFFLAVFQQAAEVLRVALSRRSWQCLTGERNRPSFFSEVKRPNLEAEVLRLDRQIEMRAQQPEMQYGFRVGDIVQHIFKSGWVGTVIGFGPYPTVKVKWDNDEAAELQYSEIGAAGLSPFEYDYFVTLHVPVDGLDDGKLRCTNMNGEAVAVLELNPHDHQMADLLLELEKQLGAPHRLPGMPIRRLKTLLPDGRQVGTSDAMRCIADVLSCRHGEQNAPH